ncbi:MAG: hypothetical protein NC221_01020 [Duncaniella sp.]|nr:hypothetical protein [Duncaniella sp.]
MAAFIVISSDNRLHYLVDGIEKCRPLNPDVITEISTGKITKSDTGYVYEYSIQGEGIRGDGAKSFSDLLSNQLASFRLAYSIPNDELVNIFFLENPLTIKDVEESEAWLQDLDRLFNRGRGHDTGFCIYRIIFTYDPESPNDITNKIDPISLKQLLYSHKAAAACSLGEAVEPTYERYLFYIDNQKSDSAALCLRKDEHDLKMPRILIDFMMLVSSSSDRYNIVAAINPAHVNSRCFSVGYAESMYYYPDVERYYIHADNRDINHRFLFSDDEMLNDVGYTTMDVEKYPFGLRKRKERLGVIYENIPFSDNINEHPNSADFKINNCIVSLKEYFKQEREKEFEDFMNSPAITGRKEIIENYEKEISLCQPKEDETSDEFKERIKRLFSDKESISQELDLQIRNFEPDCPAYIDREEIYNELCVTEEDDKETACDSLSTRYNRLVSFARSKKFMDYIKAIDNSSSISEIRSNNTNGETKNHEEGSVENLGCLFSWLKFWKYKHIDNDEFQNNENATQDRSVNIINYITIINQQIRLKKRFFSFKEDISSLEQKYDEEKNYCDNFKLTLHTNHFFPLININELKSKHDETSSSRIQESINSCNRNKSSFMSDLLQIVSDRASKYTKLHYLFIDWKNPCSFVQTISDINFPIICNELQKRAAPLANYNLTSEVNENKVIRCFFSDRPNFKDEFESVRAKIQNGNEISATESTHIASKICMFQFLPMDNEIIQNLVDLQEPDKNDMDII